MEITTSNAQICVLSDFPHLLMYSIEPPLKAVSEVTHESHFRAKRKSPPAIKPSGVKINLVECFSFVGKSSACYAAKPRNKYSLAW